MASSKKQAPQSAATAAPEAIGVFTLTWKDADKILASDLKGSARELVAQHHRSWLPAEDSVTTIPFNAADHAAVAKAGVTLKQAG